MGFRRPFSQLIAVTLGTLSNWANTDWLTANCSRIATISLGLIGLTERGNVRVLVRSVIFSLPAAWRARVSTLLTKSSALNSISLRFAAGLFPDDRPGHIVAAISDRCLQAVASEETISQDRRHSVRRGIGV